MSVCTDEFTNLKRDIIINTKDILQLENGVIKTSTGKIVEIAIGSQTGGMEIEPIVADNIIEIPGVDLDTVSAFAVRQEQTENNWSNFTLYAYLKPGSTLRTISIKVKLQSSTGDIIFEKVLLPTEYDITENSLIYNKITIPYPGFRIITLTFNEPNSGVEIQAIDSIYIEMYSFDRPQTIENLILKSYATDPIVSVPGQAWYNTTEHVWKMTFANDAGQLIIKTYKSSDDINADDFIWMSVL